MLDVNRPIDKVGDMGLNSSPLGVSGRTEIILGGRVEWKDLLTSGYG